MKQKQNELLMRLLGALNDKQWVSCLKADDAKYTRNVGKEIIYGF